MGSKGKIKSKPRAKREIELDETIGTAEEKIEGLAETLVADGVAKDLAEAQSMVLRDPANLALRNKYEEKYH